MTLTRQNSEATDGSEYDIVASLFGGVRECHADPPNILIQSV